MCANATQTLLTELTEDIEAASLIEDINQTTLPDPVASLSEAYTERIGIRDEFVWKWIYELFAHCTLGSVPQDRMASTRTRKTLLTMFVTILDDIAEADGDRITFRQARKIPFPGETVVESDAQNRDALRMAERVWSAFESSLATAPRRDEFIDLFRFDIRQTLTAIEYSLQISDTPEIATRGGSLSYGPHNMVVFPYIDVDQMASSASQSHTTSSLFS
jgi:hypothetical protein